MPLYDYDCSACGRRFEVIHRVDADPPASCPLCGSGPVRKAFAPPTIVFKGSGWAKKERRATAASKKDGAVEGGEPASETPGDKTPAAPDPTAAKGSKGSAGSTSGGKSSTNSASSD
jgi:putative FmdB family regulatory protein